ncbi:MAG: hypothetical protein U1A78_18250 [Polyangia bacterium]
MSLLGKHLHKVVSIASLVGAMTLAGCPGPMPMPDGGADMPAQQDGMVTSPDMTCDPATGGCMPADMTTTNRDMTSPPGDLATPTGDMAMGPRDMTTPPGDLATPTGDMAMSMTDMGGARDMSTPPPSDMGGARDMSTPPPSDGGMMMMGAIGAPCTDDTQCSAGPMPKCWKSNVLNNTSNPATPGGYCSSSCTSDSQCGSGGRCVDFGPGGKNCLAGCSSATACRKPGYACRFYETAGVCYPDSVFDCDPSTTGACTEAGTGKAGGCMRGAYENKGSCIASCTVGTGTCAAGAGGVKRQCIYVDTTVGTFKDKWKGPTCLDSPASPVMPGGACSYTNDCTDGYQCDGATGTCKQLCLSGGMPACTMGTCADAFKTTPMASPGICR